MVWYFLMMNSNFSTESLTPQQRWQQFRAKHFPRLSRRKLWVVGGVSVGILLLAILFILPFLLPLAGPKKVNPHTLADPNGFFVKVNQVELYYIHLSGQKETVLLIHGQGGSTVSWQSTLGALEASGFNVYALDLPGAGLSEKGLHLDYSHPALADLIISFLDQQNIEQISIVAHSYNANLATILTELYPERVNKMVLVAPTIITSPPPKIPSIAFKLPFLKRWLQVMMHLVIPEAVGEQLRSATKYDEVVTDELIRDYARVLQTQDWDLSAVGLVRDSYLNAVPYPLETIHQPILLLWGTGDGWSPPDGAKDLQAWFPNTQLVLFEGVGHLPMHEIPTTFNETLIKFLDN